MVYGVFSMVSAETEDSRGNPERIKAPETMERLTSTPPPQNVLMVDETLHITFYFNISETKVLVFGELEGGEMVGGDFGHNAERIVWKFDVGKFGVFV